MVFPDHKKSYIFIGQCRPSGTAAYNIRLGMWCDRAMVFEGPNRPPRCGKASLEVPELTALAYITCTGRRGSTCTIYGYRAAYILLSPLLQGKTKGKPKGSNSKKGTRYAAQCFFFVRRAAAAAATTPIIKKYIQRTTTTTQPRVQEKSFNHEHHHNTQIQQQLIIIIIFEGDAAAAKAEAEEEEKNKNENGKKEPTGIQLQ